jgi:hypothetical protein
MKTTNVVRSKKSKQKPEEHLQKQCVNWFRAQFPQYKKCLWSVPNGGSRNMIEAVNLKRSGVLSGVPDLQLSVNGKVYFIELKAPNGTTSELQKQMHEALLAQGFDIYILRSFNKFVSVINTILSEDAAMPRVSNGRFFEERLDSSGLQKTKRAT